MKKKGSQNKNLSTWSPEHDPVTKLLNYMVILALQFNNYFNRKVKRYTTVQDYISNSSHSAYLNNGENTDLNPNDDIATKLIINWDKEWNPDYLICINEKNGISQRWFITEKVRKCGQQYECTLKRDTIAEKYDIVVKAPCFIEKGFVNDNNPLIFNKEDFTCNQIKKSETLLHDRSAASYITIYYDPKCKSDPDSPLKGTVSSIAEPYIDTGAVDLDHWEIYENYGTGYKYPVRRNINIWVELAGRLDEGKFVVDNNCYVGNVYYNLQSDTGLSNSNYDMNAVCKQTADCIEENRTNIKNYFDNYGVPSTGLEYLTSLNGKIVKCGSDFYRVHVGEQITTSTETSSLISGNLYDQLCNAFKVGDTFKYNFSGNFTDAFEIVVTYQVYSLRFEKITNGVTTYKFDFTSCVDIQDQPFGILCLPYKGKYNYDLWYSDTIKIPDNLSILVAREICKAGVGSGSFIYDAQILPYCPIDIQSNWNDEDKEVILAIPSLESDEYTDITLSDGVTVVGCGLHPKYSKFSKTLYFNLQSNNLKLDNQCTFYRIVSPNYSGQFEFNVPRNGGSVLTFEADCTYKPYQPYIHISPIFKGLYGEDFDDARGLVCGGDFSFSLVSSAFETYKLQNKNFQEIFNRQIENLDTNYEINEYATFVKTLTGVVAGGSAAIAGAAMGHPAAAAGGMIGAISSGVGGVTSMVEQYAKHAEQRDYEMDIHNYKLGNIKALPNSLAKVDSYNNNNKMFPILEEYSCTDEEKAIFLEKIKYEGMTVNAFGHIEDYLDNLSGETFIKGKLYRLEGLNEEKHFADIIFNEIATGVYIVN